MKDILSIEVYVPPEAGVLQVKVELGFYGSGGGGYTPPPPSSGGGGGSSDNDPLYDFGGSTVTGMPAEPF